MRKFNLVAASIMVFAFTTMVFAGQNSGERRIISLSVGANVLRTNDVLIILDTSYADNDCNDGAQGTNAILADDVTDYHDLLNTLYVALAGDFKVSLAFDGCIAVDFYGFAYQVPSLAGVNLIR